MGHGPDIQYRIRRVGLYLVVESAVGLAVMWDRKTTVRILLEPRHSVSYSNSTMMMMMMMITKKV